MASARLEHQVAHRSADREFAQHMRRRRKLLDLEDAQVVGIVGHDAAPWRPKSAAATSCPCSMMPRRIARVRVKRSNSESPSSSPDRLLEEGEVLVEPLQHLEHAFAIGEEDVAPHGRVRCRDPGEVAKAARRIFDHLAARDLLEIRSRADDRVSDQMRQMAGDGEHEVVVRRIHLLDPGAERRPEGREPGDGLGIRAGRRRQDAPAAVEQGGEAGIRPAILGPGHGMGGNDGRARAAPPATPRRRPPWPSRRR